MISVLGDCRVEDNEDRSDCYLSRSFHSPTCVPPCQSLSDFEAGEGEM